MRGVVCTILVVMLTVISAVVVLGVDFSVTTVPELYSALTKAAANGEDDVVTLASGVYQGNFTYRAQDAKSLTVQGAEGTSPEDVILDGGGSGKVLSFLSSSAEGVMVLQGLTIQNGHLKRFGNNEIGGGILLGTKDGTLNLVLRNVIVENNTAEYRGGGIGLVTFGNASMRFEMWSSIVRNNQSPGGASGGQGRGGGIYASASNGDSSIDILIVNSLIYGNQANWTGGGVEINATEIGENNTVHATIINTTITGNISNMNDQSNSPGGGIRVYGYGGNGARVALDLYNSIVWGNTEINADSGQDLFIGKMDPAAVEVHANYCDLGNVVVGKSAGAPIYGAEVVIAADPLFIDPDAGNFRLADSSLCIDAGTSDLPLDLPDLDLSGNWRVCGLAPDLGAYEHCER